MYEIIFSKKAKIQLIKLDKLIQKRIISVLERARIRPQDYFERLVGEKAYKLRAGDYRIIADIINEKLLILVIEIGHRKNIYKH
ncbi:cytotoxic translational repressor of toxin-antitoxin stability system [Candidatus Pacearchaeota archaeon CG10_big_fil_rev_8_21_14_0_10_30_48]|nr:MAG: cytotoxic translational repressor of toxin-antitoxin stability system [Candidatus Pacearchaeota archaeon CG10_big_fil_rev_8_21_14_0_10_30_48]